MKVYIFRLLNFVLSTINLHELRLWRRIHCAFNKNSMKLSFRRILIVSQAQVKSKRSIVLSQIENIESIMWCRLLRFLKYLFAVLTC